MPATRADAVAVRCEAIAHLEAVGDAAAEMHRVATARGLLVLAAAILGECRRGASRNQRANKDELSSHDLPFWLRFRRLVGRAPPPEECGEHADGRNAA